MLGDVPVGKGTDEVTASLLPLHGCPRSEGTVEIDDLAGQRSGWAGCRLVTTDVLNHGGSVGPAEVFPSHADCRAPETQVLGAGLA
eukprot:7709839-Heterocapsa_arctica.AAC.1